MGKSVTRAVAAVAILALAAVAFLYVEARRTGRTVRELIGEEAATGEAPAPSPPSDRSPVFSRRAVGRTDEARPMIAHVRIADLDLDGSSDILACDVAAKRVFWIRQGPRGAFSEIALADTIGAPVHAEACDVDLDGDLDVLVASMGVMLPSNEKLGSVIVLENDGRERFAARTLASRVSRVTDVRGGDLDADGDIDLAVGQFGYDQGEVTWMENRGGWRFERHVLLNLSGTIHSPIADMDGDGDPDVVALVSQEWEEIHLFENNGHGTFSDRVIFGAATDDYCSSGICLADADGDGDVDLLYTNGDAFVATDYRPLPNHGVQWLENVGGLEFAFHRLGDFPGAYGPAMADLDGDGDVDGVAVSCFNYWDRPEARSVMWYENDGSKHFIARDIASAPTHLVTLDAGDLDGDGRVDLVTGGMALYPPFERIERVSVWLQVDAG